MKALLFLSLLLSSVYANHISWLGDYNKALEKAKKEHKPMMVLLVEEDCKRCNELIKKEFMNHDYVDILNEQVISVIVTRDSKISYPIELFYSTSFPSLFFVNSEVETFLAEPFYGKVNREKLLEVIDKIKS